MGYLAIAWIGYLIFIATRSPSQRETHLLVLWSLMGAGCVLAIGQWLWSIL